MIEIVDVDLSRPGHAQAVPALIAAYARDDMGGGKALPEEVIAVLAQRLRERPDYFGVLAFDGSMPVGLINCFEGFSTFLARPLVNIHDVYVAPGYRGQALARRMLDRVEQVARQHGCAKLTLEVLEGNAAALASYSKFGFDSYALDPQNGRAMFWQKVL
ncbi:acetyltransferase YpeA [mine drainage metagenome]|uniref:Acetyltransferase YpeA n=1 Tax=mine drainage metagenome TaxID=410659 RepID=A0A1J5PBH8_9ZZZZ